MIILSKRWQQSEERYLKRYYYSKSITDIAEHLNRSVIAVRHKANNLGLHRYDVSVSAEIVSNAFGCDKRSVALWNVKYNMPCKKITCGKKQMTFVDVEEFWEWAENHKEIIPFHRYEKYSLLPEPNWLREEVVKSKNREVKKGTAYSEQEIIQVKSMLRKGYTVREIASETQRTFHGIKYISRKINSQRKEM